MSAFDPRLLNDCVFVSIESLRLPPPKRSASTPPAELPDVARARHMRRELERAAEHGTALLAALGLPQLVDEEFEPLDGTAIGDALDVVVAHLDAIDAPDEDLEEDPDLEKTGDEELDLGWSALHSQIKLGAAESYGRLRGKFDRAMGMPRRSTASVFYEAGRGYAAERELDEDAFAELRAQHIRMMAEVGPLRFVLDRVVLFDEAPVPGDLPRLKAGLEMLVAWFGCGEG